MDIFNKLFVKSAWTDADKWLRLRSAYQEKKKGRIRRGLLKFKYNRINYRNNASIPITVEIGENLCLPHGISGIFISIGSQIGRNCTIFHHVTLGTNATQGSKNLGAPIIGDNVFIGAGAVIIGGVHIGNNVRIGANTTVVQDVPDNCTVVSESRVKIIPCEADRDNSFHSFKELPFEQLTNKAHYQKRSKI